jgi:hypothetical protein
VWPALARTSRRLSRMAGTLIACAEGTTERAFLAGLERVCAWKISGSQLSFWMPPAPGLLQPLLCQAAPLLGRRLLRRRKLRQLVQPEPAVPLLLGEADPKLELRRVHEPHEPAPPGKRVGDSCPGGGRLGEKSEQPLRLVLRVRRLTHPLEDSGDRVAQLGGRWAQAAVPASAD